MSISRDTRQRATARRAQRRRQARILSVVVVGVLTIVVSGILILASLRSAERQRLVAEGREIGFSIGDSDAPVLMEEFSDYSCSHCAEFAEVSHQIIETYVEDGTLRVIHMPTSFLNLPNSEIAAAAAVCAGEQDNYWEMYDALFELHRSEGPTAFTPERMLEIAGMIGLDQALLEDCVNSPATASLLAQIDEVARARGVTGTPTIYVNGQRAESWAYEALSGMIESSR